MDETPVVKERITYPQNWPVYDKAQIEEKATILEMLGDLVQEIEEPAPREGAGRHRLSLRDLIFASTLKVYTQFSLRRFMSDLEYSKVQGLVDYAPCFASVGHFMEREDITPILKRLVSISSMPLKDVESVFAIDSSGFRTSKFNEYFRVHHNVKKEHKWIKAHICCGVKTNVITAIEVTPGNVNDSLEFVPLTLQTNENGFQIKEMTADKAYCSIGNYNATLKAGAVGYIPFKSNATGMSDRTIGSKGKVWRRMFYYFKMNHDEFMAHYHMRSNVETVFSMMKAKFGELLKSKSHAAQVNELLLKALCHNLCVLNEEAHRLGFMPNFGTEQKMQ